MVSGAAHYSKKMRHLQQKVNATSAN